MNEEFAKWDKYIKRKASIERWLKTVMVVLLIVVLTCYAVAILQPRWLDWLFPE